MKKWYVISGILAVLWLISLGTCSNNSAEVDKVKGELADVRDEYKAELNEVVAQLSAVEGELDGAKDDLADVSAELEAGRFHLARLKATKEINFGNGLRVFDLDAGDYWVEGKVENISSAPMDEVVVFVAFYDWDGSFGGVVRDSVSDLFPGEVMEWRATVSFYGSWHGQPGLCDVYAIGGSRGK